MRAVTVKSVLPLQSVEGRHHPPVLPCVCELVHGQADEEILKALPFETL